MLNDEMGAERARLSDYDYLSAYEGHFVDGIPFFAFRVGDVLEVRLLGETERPAMVLHLEEVYAYSLQKPTDLDGALSTPCPCPSCLLATHLGQLVRKSCLKALRAS